MIWNLIGRNFTHTTRGHSGKSGTHGKIPKSIEWSFNFQGNISFYLDQNILNNKEERRDLRKFGWLLESKSIKPNTYQNIKDNYKNLFKIYENIFTHDRELIKLDDRFKFTICCGYWVKDLGIFSKSKLVSAISSGKNMCEGHRFRNEFIEKYTGNFDLFGNKYKHLPTKEEGLKDYMFSVSIENGSYSSYFTEKILDCFATGTIPVYYGSPDISNFFNQKGIIFIDENFSFDQLTAENYHRRMDAIIDNYQRLNNFHTAEDYIFNTYKNLFFL